MTKYELLNQAVLSCLETGRNDCVFIDCGLDQDGYPVVHYPISNKQLRANRVSLSIKLGSYDFDVARHTCDVPRCINPNHLLPGTVADNNRDRQERNRTAQQKGMAHGGCKLTDADVIEIRNLAVVCHHKEVANRYGISRSMVGKIVSGKGWSHLGGPITPRAKSGNNHPKASLTWEIVREIRRIHSNKEMSQASIAKKFNTSCATINRVVKNVLWREI